MIQAMPSIGQRRLGISGSFSFSIADFLLTAHFRAQVAIDPILINWTDGKQLSEGAGVGFRRTPSLWNVAYNRWYFWDGRADTLWSQALKTGMR
jgi:Di-haem cytochrome c peroxidase